MIYKSAPLYEAVMLVLYGRHYRARYRAIANLIEQKTSVLDLCCGPAVLYRRYLRQKGVQYTGLDMSKPFISSLQGSGAHGQIWDLQRDEELPRADSVVMQASLYHFLPAPEAVVDRMLRAARRQVIIAEPIRNLTSSNSPVLSSLGRRMAASGDGHSHNRFTEESLSRFFERYASRTVQSFAVPGGREHVYVLNPTSPE